LLGDLLLEERGQITGQRVLDAESQRVEISYTAVGKYKGNIDYLEIATYWSVPANIKKNESCGEGQGIMTTRDGDSAIWKSHGIGQVLSSGSRSLKGSAVYRLPQPADKGSVFAEIDNVMVVFEYEIGANGNYFGKAWGWK
jgi:hypothetical protein